MRLDTARPDAAPRQAATMRTAVYDALPTWRMLVFDGTLYLSAFAADGVLHGGFLRQFDDMWRQARRLDGIADL